MLLVYRLSVLKINIIAQMAIAVSVLQLDSTEQVKQLHNSNSAAFVVCFSHAKAQRRKEEAKTLSFFAMYT